MTIQLFSGSRVVVLTSLDRRCVAHGAALSCAVTGPDPAPVSVLAVAPRGATIRAEVRVAEPDPELGNNAWHGLLD